jgi:hypothetical protein
VKILTVLIVVLLIVFLGTPLKPERPRPDEDFARELGRHRQTDERVAERVLRDKRHFWRIEPMQNGIDSTPDELTEILRAGFC